MRPVVILFGMTGSTDPHVNPFDPATSSYPRDMEGYGRNPPDPKWPGGAILSLQIVVNDEADGENSMLHGDAGSETFLTDGLPFSADVAARPELFVSKDSEDALAFFGHFAQ